MSHPSTSQTSSLFLGGAKISKANILFINVFVLLFLLMPLLAMADGLLIGTEAPFFRVKSGTNKELTLDMVRGKVVVILYETKDITEMSRNLKRELNKCYDELSNDLKISIIRIPVINCSSAFWPISEIWKNKLRENSRKDEITLYGDWDGKMFHSYKMRDGKTNVVIIDKMGVIRYFESGKLDDAEIIRIKSLLKELIYGE